MRVVTKKEVHWDYPCNHHLADLMSVSDQKIKIHCSFVGSYQASTVFWSRTVYTERANLTVTMCVTQFSGVWNYFSWFRLKNGWYSCAWSLGFDYWCHALKLKSEAERQASTEKPIAVSDIQETEFSDEHSSFSRISWIVQWRFCFLKREFLSQRNYVVHLWS